MCVYWQWCQSQQTHIEQDKSSTSSAFLQDSCPTASCSFLANICICVCIYIYIYIYIYVHIPHSFQACSQFVRLASGSSPQKCVPHVPLNRMMCKSFFRKVQIDYLRCVCDVTFSGWPEDSVTQRAVWPPCEGQNLAQDQSAYLRWSPIIPWSTTKLIEWWSSCLWAC